MSRSGKWWRSAARSGSFARGDMILRTAAARPGERLRSYASMIGGLAEWALATDVAALAEDRPDLAVKPYDRLQKVVPAAFDPIDTGAFIGLKERSAGCGGWAIRRGAAS